MKLDYLVKLHNTLHHYLPILFHKKDKVVWCCSGFKGLYKEQGQRGFSIYYDEEQLNRPVFFLIFRSLDPGVLEESQMKKHSLKLEADAPVTLSA